MYPRLPIMKRRVGYARLGKFTPRRSRHPLAVLAMVAMLALVGWSEVHATELPGKTAVADFELTSDYVFELDGRDLTSAEIYFSRYEVAYLVIAAELSSPLLISPRGHSVQRIRREKFSPRPGLGADLEADAAWQILGRYRSRRGAMIFAIDGKPARLKPRPPLLGPRSSVDVQDLFPRYGHFAKAHGRSKKAGLRPLLAAGENLRIRVYFGSWSPICERLVPRIMAFEEKLKTPQIRFEYYGLPRRIIDDPLVKEEGIYAVPTAVVYRDGEEIGRLIGLQLDAPGEAFGRLLAGEPAR